MHAHNAAVVKLTLMQTLVPHTMCIHVEVHVYDIDINLGHAEMKMIICLDQVYRMYMYRYM